MSQYARLRRQSAHDKCLDSIDAAATTAVRLTTLVHEYAADGFRSWWHLRVRAQRRDIGGQAQARSLWGPGVVFRRRQLGWDRPRCDDRRSSTRGKQRLAIHRWRQSRETEYI